jgi:hypothetical protein
MTDHIAHLCALSLQMTEPSMTEATGTAAAALPTEASVKRAAQIVILDPIFGGSSDNSSEASPEALPTLTNGILRLAVAAVQAVKAANDSRLKAAGRPVVNKDRSLAKLVVHICGTDAPADDAAAEREGKRLHMHLQTVDSRAERGAAIAGLTLLKELQAAGRSKDEAWPLVAQAKLAKAAAADKEKVPPPPPRQPPPRPQPPPHPDSLPPRRVPPPPQPPLTADSADTEAELAVLRRELIDPYAHIQAMLQEKEKWAADEMDAACNAACAHGEAAIEREEKSHAQWQKYSGLYFQALELNEGLEEELEQTRKLMELQGARLLAVEAERDASRAAHASDIGMLEAAGIIERMPDGSRWQGTPMGSADSPPPPPRNPAHSPARGSPRRTPKPSPSRMLSFLPGHLGR